MIDYILQNPAHHILIFLYSNRYGTQFFKVTLYVHDVCIFDKGLFLWGTMFLLLPVHASVAARVVFTVNVICEKPQQVRTDAVPHAASEPSRCDISTEHLGTAWTRYVYNYNISPWLHANYNGVYHDLKSCRFPRMPSENYVYICGLNTSCLSLTPGLDLHRSK